MRSHLLRLRPSWREAFLLLFSFSFVCALLLTALFARTRPDQENLVAEWFQLWDRCRLTIESGAPLDTRHLVPTMLSNLPDLTDDTPDRFSAWAPLNGRFAIRSGETGPPERPWRSCNVELRDDKVPLRRSEIAAIYLAFLDQRTQLLIGGEHEAWDPSPLYGMVSLGFRPLRAGPAGCPVINALFSDMGNTFYSVSGDQSLHCKTPSAVPE